MKPVAFDYARPFSLSEAVALLDAGGTAAKVLAGGQTLGPMLNLRLVRPELLVDVTRIPELTRMEEEPESIVLGACTTHAAIEDGRIPEGTRGLMPAVARGIAYRAIRNRGTIGGSLAHADPAADWITWLTVVDAEALIFGPSGRRSVPIAAFMTGVFETVMEASEILEAVRVPKVAAGTQCGLYKVCRKTGEFADAIGAILWDPERSLCRLVVGATDSTPIVLENRADLFGGAIDPPLHPRFDRQRAAVALGEHGLVDPFDRQVHAVALERAVRQVE
ncbi:MAG: FAD binding domain-containing protein [Gemmatimonadetes bacterium]|nr:FAD binding domain-containing protein [Gemmatimonadota bacterium]